MTEQMITGIINEEWRSISIYVKYRVSNIGRGRNTNSGRNLKPQSAKDGYFIIQLSDKRIFTRDTGCIELSLKNFSKILTINQMQITLITIPKIIALIIYDMLQKSKNNMNMSKQRSICSSMFKGVPWHKQHQKWRAVTRIKSRNKYTLIILLLKKRLQELTMLSKLNYLVSLQIRKIAQLPQHCKILQHLRH